MLRRTLDYVTRLPLHPFKLAHALIITTPAPYRRQRDNGPRTVDELAVWTKQHPVLIHVERDAPYLAEGISDILEINNITTHRTGNRDQFLAAAETIPTALIVVDYAPRLREGERALTNLITNPATHPIPRVVIFDQNRVLPQQRSQVDAAGRWITVPFDAEEFVELVKTTLLEQGRWGYPARYNPQQAARLLAGQQ